MTLFDLSKRRWLFCMTHPDDEISICVWIRRLVENGNDVFISWTHSIPVREAEARAFAARVGVPPERLHFHGATDGRVLHELTTLRPRFDQMLAEVVPDVAVCGAFEQGHLDHDATNFLLRHCFAGEILEVPFYHVYTSGLQRINEFSDPTGQSVLPLTREETRFKLSVAKMYRSQNIWWLLLAAQGWEYVRFSPSRLARRELLRVHAVADFRAPAHPEHLRTRVERCAKWREWLEVLGRSGY